MIFGIRSPLMNNVNLLMVDFTKDTTEGIKVILINQNFEESDDHIKRKKIKCYNFFISVGQIIREYTHCTQLYCWDDVTLLLKTLPGAPALSGTRCNTGKICYMGRCQNVESIGPTQGPTKNPSTIPGVIKNVCDSINTFVTSIINIFG